MIGNSAWYRFIRSFYQPVNSGSQRGSGNERDAGSVALGTDEDAAHAKRPSGLVKRLVVFSAVRTATRFAGPAEAQRPNEPIQQRAEEVNHPPILINWRGVFGGE